MNTSETAEVIPSEKQLTCCQGKTVRSPFLTILSTLPVNDDNTSGLMQRFDEFLATGELTKAEALRQAQLTLLYAEDVETRLEVVQVGAPPTFREGFKPVGDRHPYHWAPFVLIGNGQ